LLRRDEKEGCAGEMERTLSHCLVRRAASWEERQCCLYADGGEMRVRRRRARRLDIRYIDLVDASVSSLAESNDLAIKELPF
jgi:hypothetical protein